MNVSAMIMAGGRGSRMRDSGVAVVKPLVEVGGVPLLLRNVRAMLRARIRHVVVAISERNPEIARFVETRARAEAGKIGAHIECFVEPGEAGLGTIGAAAELAGRAELVVVTNADLYASIDAGALVRAHRERAADLTIATHIERYRLELGEVICGEDGRVVEYLEKPEKESVISSGTYVVGARALALLERGRRADAPDLVRRALGAALFVSTFRHDTAFIDVNDAARVRIAEETLPRSALRVDAPDRVELAVLEVSSGMLPLFEARSNPSTFVEPGEQPREAAMRKARELGLDVDRRRVVSRGTRRERTISGTFCVHHVFSIV